MSSPARLIEVPATTVPEAGDATYVAVRHELDDEMTIDGTFDNGLVESGEANARVLGDEIVSRFQASQQYDSVCIWYSGKRRTAQTADIIAQRLAEAGIVTTLRCVDGIEELRQGVLDLDHLSTEQRSAVLHEAWRLYGDAVTRCDMDYRFGDPARVVEGTPLAVIDGAFCEFGENQREFTLRIYSFVRDLLSHDFGRSMPVIVAHRATVTKMQRVIGATDPRAGLIDGMSAGALPVIEREVGHVRVGHGEGIILRLGRLARLATVSVLNSEIEHLLRSN